MVSREGEEAEYHETDSNLSTPPRMGSIKISSSDPLQNRLSIESCLKLGRPNSEVTLCDYDQVVSVTNEGNGLCKDNADYTVRIPINMDQSKDSTEEQLPRVPEIPPTEEGNAFNQFHIYFTSFFNIIIY